MKMTIKIFFLINNAIQLWFGNTFDKTSLCA